MKTKDEIKELAYENIKHLSGDCSKYDAERAYIKGYYQAVKDLNELSKIKCYYDDEFCEGNVSDVNSHHGFLCEKCLKEYNSIKD